VGEKCEYYCQQGAACIEGTCVKALAFGAPCGEVGAPFCEYGTFCESEDAKPTCQKVLEGGPCNSSAGCFDHEFCDTATKRCRPRLGLGADCSSDSVSCQSFTACDPVTKRCVEASHIGQLCGNLLGFSFLCEKGGTCVFGAEANHCVDPRANGAACAQDFECRSSHCIAGMCADPQPNDGVACEDASMCTSGFCSTDLICVAPGPNGAACVVGSECTSGLCTNSVCTALSADGAACSLSFACASGFCSNGVCTACP
jgi:hypothetical protein